MRSNKLEMLSKVISGVAVASAIFGDIGLVALKSATAWGVLGGAGILLVFISVFISFAANSGCNN